MMLRRETVRKGSGQWPVAGNVKGKGLIHEFAQISTKKVKLQGSGDRG